MMRIVLVDQKLKEQKIIMKGLYNNVIIITFKKLVYAINLYSIYNFKKCNFYLASDCKV